MIKLNKNNTLVFAIIGFIAGIICLIFYKTNAIFGCLSCLFLGFSFILLGKSSRLRYFAKLIELDKMLDDVIKDVQIKGEKSEYNGFDEQNKTDFLRLYIKKNKRKHVYFYIFGGSLIFASIFMII